MKSYNRLVTRIFVFSTLLFSPVLSRAQSDNDSKPAALNSRIEELQRELDDLRSQMAALKEAPAHPAGSGSSAASLASSSGATSIASLLGPTTLSGFVDMYYGYNANQPVSRSSGFRSFDALSNQFALNLVELVVDKTPEVTNSRTGYHIALGYGQAINAVNGSDPGGLGFDQYLKEAYFSYLAPVGKGLQVDFGKFVTPAGAEVIETKDNWNYSRGLLFSYAIPFFHFGMRAKYTFNDHYAVAGYLVNGWNNIVDNNTGKTYGGSFFWNPNKKFGVVQNYLIGPELSDNNNAKRQLSDTVVTYSPTGRLSFIVNYDYGRGDRIASFSKPVYWTGAAGYLRYAFNSSNAFATRYEYFDDKYGVMTGGLPKPQPQQPHGLTGTSQRH